MIEKTKAYTYKGVPYSTKEEALEAYARELLALVFPVYRSPFAGISSYSHRDVAGKLKEIQEVINKVQAMRDSII